MSNPLDTFDNAFFRKHGEIVDIVHVGAVTFATIKVGSVYGTGFAVCGPNDEPDEEIGARIAYRRALKHLKRQIEQLGPYLDTLLLLACPNATEIHLSWPTT